MKDRVVISKNASAVLRGIAALLVLISHYVWQYYPVFGETFAFYGLTRLGVYGVNLFLLVSGYGLTVSLKKDTDTGRFWKKRLLGMYLPYLLIAGAIFLLHLIFEGVGEVNLSAEIWNLVSGKIYWFIQDILILYLLIFLVWKWTLQKSLERQPQRDFYSEDIRKGLILAIAVVLQMIVLFYIGRQSFWYVSNFAFALGALAGTLPIPMQNKKVRLIGIVSFGVWILLFALQCAKLRDRMWGLPGSVYESGLNVLFAVGVIAWIVPEIEKLKEHNVAAWVGTFSLELYLVHEEIQILLGYWGMKDMPLTLVSTVLAFACAWLLHQGWERILQVLKR